MMEVTRAVAAGQVSPVSTEPLSFTDGLLGVTNFSANVHAKPPRTQRTLGCNMLKLARWLRAVRKNLFLPTAFRSSERTISLTVLSAKGVACKVSERSIPCSASKDIHQARSQDFQKGGYMDV